MVYPCRLLGMSSATANMATTMPYCQDNEMTWLKWDDFNQTLFDSYQANHCITKKIQSLQQEAWWSDENVEWLNTGETQ